MMDIYDIGEDADGRSVFFSPHDTIGEQEERVQIPYLYPSGIRCANNSNNYFIILIIAVVIAAVSTIVLCAN